MSASPVGKKRKVNKENEGEEKGKVEETNSGESNRKSGRMSLRPNRRVNVNALYPAHDEIEEYDDHSDEITHPLDDVDDVLDGDISEDYKLGRREANDDDGDDDGLEDDTELKKYKLSKKPFGKGTKRRIYFAPKKINKAEKVEEDPSSYSYRKDLVCALCCKEIDRYRLSNYKNIFKDTTPKGVRLIDVFKTIVKVDINEESSGCHLCTRCSDLIVNLEATYTAYRMGIEEIKNIFTLGQKMMDADLGTGKSTDSKISDEPTSMTNFVKTNNVTLKIVNLASERPFNGLGVGTDFNLVVEKLYHASIVHESQFPQADGTENGGIITLTFDINTGSIEKANDIASAEIIKNNYNPHQPQVYLTIDEFDQIKKRTKDKIIYLQHNDFDELAGKLIVGHKISHQVVLSKELSTAYVSQLPNMTERFICGDCNVSSDYFHHLANHIQMVHKYKEPELIQKDEIIAKVGTLKSTSRTGEVPTLEKPFQCDQCDKCFSEYLNMSNHVDHYHGYNRKCNVEGCEAVLTSIQDFTLHHVRHGDENFELPTDFKLKTKILLSCPMCTAKVQGVWKYFSHTYIHDKEPRFKCPVCSKRTHKVQNFREHLLRHKGPQYKNRKCYICAKTFYPQDLYRHIKQVHPSSLANPECANAEGDYSCDECGQAFPLLQNLRVHQQIHTPKDTWNFKCTECQEVFPSEARLRIHHTIVHPSYIQSDDNNEVVNAGISIDPDSATCLECNQNFESKKELEIHLKDFHGIEMVLEEINSQEAEQIQLHVDDNDQVEVEVDEGAVSSYFQCMDCGFQESTVMAARKHYRLVHRDKPFTCNLCKRIFNKEFVLHQHLIQEHFDVIGEEGKDHQFPCSICGKIFNKAVTRLRHVRFMHLHDFIDIREMGDEVTVIGDQIAEYENDNIIKLHTIP